MPPSEEAQRWAQMVARTARPEGVAAVIVAVNEIIDARRLTRAEVILACSQMLAADIVAAGEPKIAAEVRSAILSLIDGYAMQGATETD